MPSLADFARKKSSVFLAMGAITAGSIALSVGLTWLAMQMRNGFADHMSLLVAAIIPLLVAPVTSWFVLAALHRIILLKEELDHLARTDSLTGLANRRHFLERGEQMLAEQGKQRFAILAIDLDHFKSINDRWGHAGGDLALASAARALAGAIRHRSDLAGRLGGEEFAALISDTTEHSALVVAERLREEIAAIRVPMPNGEIRFSASIGHAIVEQGDSLADALGRADRAMYISKASGRNRVTCAPPSALCGLLPAPAAVAA